MWITYLTKTVFKKTRFNNLWIFRKIIPLIPRQSYFLSSSIISSIFILRLLSLRISLEILSHACITVV